MSLVVMSAVFITHDKARFFVSVYWVELLFPDSVK
jgi:hypothetical protein